MVGMYIKKENEWNREEIGGLEEVRWGCCGSKVVVEEEEGGGGGVAEFMIWKEEATGGPETEFMKMEVVDIGSVDDWVEIPKSFSFLDQTHGFF